MDLLYKLSADKNIKRQIIHLRLIWSQKRIIIKLTIIRTLTLIFYISHNWLALRAYMF